ncbi:MAG TPA: oligosaccharide flippase family protein [Hyphomonas sp.]|nr:oligosaccharide flippase family protein [Hyphomonas sp.]
MFVTSISNISIRVFSILLILLLNVQLTRALGPEGFGVLAFTLAWVQLAAVFVQFGLPEALLRRAATAAAGESNLRSDVGSSLVLMLLLWGAVLASFSLSSLTLGEPLGGYALAVPSLLLVPLLALGPVFAGVLRGLGSAVTSQLAEQILRPALYCTALAAVTLTGAEIFPADATWLQALTTAIAVAGGATFLLRKLPSTGAPVSVRPIQQGLLALPFFSLTLAYGMSAHLPVILLGQLVNDTDIAMYRIGVQLADAFNIVLIGISVTIGPSIAINHANGDKENLQKILVKAHRIAVATILGPIIILLWVGDEILIFLFGPPFAPAYEPLAILLVGKLLYAGVSFSGLVLTMSGNATLASKISLTTLGLNLLSLPMIVTEVGYVGAAVSGAIASLACNVAFTVHIARTSRIDISIFGLKPREGE